MKTLEGCADVHQRPRNRVSHALDFVPVSNSNSDDMSSGLEWPAARPDQSIKRTTQEEHGLKCLVVRAARDVEAAVAWYSLGNARELELMVSLQDEWYAFAEDCADHAQPCCAISKREIDEHSIGNVGHAPNHIQNSRNPKS